MVPTNRTMPVCPALRTAYNVQEGTTVCSAFLGTPPTPVVGANLTVQWSNVHRIKSMSMEFVSAMTGVSNSKANVYSVLRPPTKMALCVSLVLCLTPTVQLVQG